MASFLLTLQILCLCFFQTSYLQHNHMKFSGSPFGDINSMSPRNGPGGPNSPLYSQTLANNLSNSQSGEVHKLQLDLSACKTRLDHWEQAYSQAKMVSLSMLLYDIKLSTLC